MRFFCSLVAHEVQNDGECILGNNLLTDNSLLESADTSTKHRYDNFVSNIIKTKQVEAISTSVRIQCIELEKRLVYIFKAKKFVYGNKILQTKKL